MKTFERNIIIFNKIMTLFVIFASLSLFSLTLGVKPSYEYHPQPQWEPLPEHCKSDHDQIKFNKIIK